MATHTITDLKTYAVSNFIDKFNNSSNEDKISRLLNFRPPLLIVDYSGILIYYKELAAIDFKYIGVIDRAAEIERNHHGDLFILAMIDNDDDLYHFELNFTGAHKLLLWHK